MTRLCRTISVLSFALLFVSSVAAQDRPSSDDLLDKIRQLEDRIDELESSEDERDVTHLETTVNALSARVDDYAQEGGWEVYWDKSFHFKGGSNFQLKFGGRIQNDWGWFGQDDDLEDIAGVEEKGIGPIGHLEDGTEFRRVRLYFAGTVYKNVFFKAQYDFAGGGTGIRDMYIGLKNLSVLGSLRVGHQKEFFGLEQLTSSKYVTFQERSLADVFTPGRNNGIAVYNTAADNRIWWGIGVYRPDTDGNGFAQEDGTYALTLRVAGTPIHEDGGDHVLHVGFAFSWRNPGEDSVRFRQRPEAHLLPRFVDTGDVINDADNVYLLGGEAAWVSGAFSIQAELMAAIVDSEFADDPTFWGFYAEISYFLTGEHRNYDGKSSVFKRVSPNANAFDGSGGSGAWQLAARISHIDLNDGDITGGEVTNFTFGVNWLLNPVTRVTFNFIYSDVDDRKDGEGQAYIFTMRFQIEF